MSRTELVVSGDTWESVAQRVYGSEELSRNLRSANPGQPISAPLPLTTVLVPDLPNSPNALTSQPTIINAASKDEVTIILDGVTLKTWLTISLNEAIDSVSTMTLSHPFDPNNTQHVELFRPLSFKPVSVYVGGLRIFRGTMIDVIPKVNPQSSTVELSFYSVPGILEDVTISAADYPLQFSGLNITQIAENVCKPYGISVVQAADPGPAFQKATGGVSMSVFNFLSNLAEQRNLIMSSTVDGELLLQQGADETAEPVGNFIQGQLGMISITPTFDPRKFKTHLTGIATDQRGLTVPSYTVNNTHISPGTFRPFTYNLTNTKAAEVQNAVESENGRMMGAVASYRMVVPDWENPKGDRWLPNTFINVKAPGAMIYESYKFLIRSVTFRKSANKKTAVLDLVFPGTYSGETIYLFPWDLA